MDSTKKRPEIKELIDILKTREAGGGIMATNTANIATKAPITATVDREIVPNKERESINDIILPTGILRTDRE